MRNARPATMMGEHRYVGREGVDVISIRCLVGLWMGLDGRCELGREDIGGGGIEVVAIADGGCSDVVWIDLCAVGVGIGTEGRTEIVGRTKDAESPWRHLGRFIVVRVVWLHWHVVGVVVSTTLKGVVVVQDVLLM